MKGLLTFSLLLLTGLVSLNFGQPIAKAQNIKSTFKGDILATSDADMSGGAYVDGKLNKVKGVEDQLSLIQMENGSPKVVSTIEASNSVMGWPSIIAWHPAMKYAYVAETYGQYQGEKQKVKDVWKDMPKGTKMTVLDFSNPNNTSIVQEVKLGEILQGVSVNSLGNLLVSSSKAAGKEIAVSRLDNGKIRETAYFTSEHIDPKEKQDAGVVTVEFHPRENVFAANLNNRSIVFYKIEDVNGKLSIKQVGKPLEKIGKKLSVGDWHPSGKFFIISDVAWGDSALGFLYNGKGKYISLAYDPNGNHKIASKIKTGLSPEGADLSPDGNYAVTVNMRRTWAPAKGMWFVSGKNYASLSLIKVNPQTGELTKIGKDYGFVGALPEDAIFDSESNSLAVTVYHDRKDTQPTEGWIDFWELQDEKLVFTGKQVKVTRGVHNLLLIN